MTMTAPGGASRAELSAAACLFHGFSDPHRLQILQHLACLRECGLVTARPEGRAMVYALSHADALEDLWAAAERLLELTGHRVALCTNEAMRPGPDDATATPGAGTVAGAGA
ncbi:ArsR family transcriptional regulator [Nocardioides sp.]|uniref:ArsR family transcriptional regulator n=1 Tax=Nocardioides sp. TaxID=35761 RepID=UPI00351832E0